ncbi:MAG TPA: hypothetical protein PK765_01685 [bacterium]|nr:hypothetical protein [bacterium]
MHAQILVLKKSRTPFFALRKTAREHFSLSFNQTYILSLVLIGLLGIYYVWSLNVNATKGYALRTLDLERRTLQHEENLLAIKVAEIESLEAIETNPMIAAMEKAIDPQFLVVADSYYTYQQQ